MGLNTDLLKVAAWASHARQQGRPLTKQAFQPPPPPDPAAGGAPPPGGPPPGPGGAPMDPAMMGGGAPPMDPSMGGGMPPPAPGPVPGGGGPGGPDIAGAVQKAVTDAMAQSGMKGNVGPNGKPTAPKPDINTIATDVFQLKKMFLHFLRMQGIELPPDILDGPNRDPMTGAPAASPTGGSDVQPGASAQGQSLNGAGPQSAIKPIEPMQGAFPSPGGGMGGGGGAPGGGMPKAGQWEDVAAVGRPSNFSRMQSKVAAVALLCRKRSQPA